MEQKRVRVGNMAFGVCVLVETVGEWNVQIDVNVLKQIDKYWLF